MTKTIVKITFFLVAFSLIISMIGCASTPKAIQFAGGSITIAGNQAGDQQETIFYRKAGNGPQTIVLVPGNNTSGAIFEPIMEIIAGEEWANAYTVFTFDYRGSGLSSYNTEIRGLNDFAIDFEKTMQQIPEIPEQGVALLGYSMGFAVALEMAIENPQRYSALIGLAPVGTRGTRVGFNEASAGTDALGNNYTNGDWVPVADEEAGIEAARFQQRSWQGAARTRETVSFVWNMLVINDTVGFDLATFTMDDPSFTQSATYHSQIRDVMNIDYMPRSLFYSHAFNISNSDITHTNNDGSQIIIPGDGRISQLPDSIPVLLVKATTDFANWQGDQVIYDNYIATSKYDFKQAGAQVTAILIDGGYGYDHGFPTVHPLETVNLVDSFLKNALTSAEVASQALDGTPVSFYPNNETEFETNTFTGF